MLTYLDENIRFAKWCQSRYDLYYLRALTPEMAEAYITELHDRELSGGYIGKVKAGIRKLDVAMREMGWRRDNAPDLLAMGGGWHSDRHPERVYTLRQAEAIIGYMRQHARDGQAADVAQLQLVAGLRITEAVMLRGQDIDTETYAIHAVKGTKGGRPRKIGVEIEHLAFLEGLAARAEEHSDGHVFQGRGHRGQSLTKRTQNAVRYACERLGIVHYGTHGFRRAWAQEWHKELLGHDLNDHQARQAVAEGLGHGRVAVTYSYIPV